MVCERRFDPSHIPFAHHKIMGPATRDKVQPLEVTTTADVTPQGVCVCQCVLEGVDVTLSSQGVGGGH